jgi:hypothetical protein
MTPLRDPDPYLTELARKTSVLITMDPRHEYGTSMVADGRTAALADNDARLLAPDQTGWERSRGTGCTER